MCLYTLLSCQYQHRWLYGTHSIIIVYNLPICNNTDCIDAHIWSWVLKSTFLVLYRYIMADSFIVVKIRRKPHTCRRCQFYLCENLAKLQTFHACQFYRCKNPKETTYISLTNFFPYGYIKYTWSQVIVEFINDKRFKWWWPRIAKTDVNKTTIRPQLPSPLV